MAWTPWFIRRRRDRDRDDELQSHLAHHIEDLVGRGVPPDEARRQARVMLGNARARREELDDMQRLPFVETFVADLRYAVRVLRRTPGFAFTAIATLGLVIGANTAVFSLANGLLLTPLPFPHAERLALLRADQRSPRGTSSSTSVDGVAWRALASTPWVEHSAVFTNWTAGVNLAVNNRATFVNQQRVGAGFFRTLGVPPFMGREFEPAEDIPNGPAVAIVSHDLWMRALGGVSDIVGKTMLLRGESWQIVGVMPEGFRGTTDADVWTPLRPSTSGEGGGTNYQVLVRVPDGQPWIQAEESLSPALADALRAAGMPDEVIATAGLTPLRDVLVADTEEPIVLLGAAVIMVLVIACVNLAALLLARGGSRTKEIATRMALGSGRRAVVRQLMVENLVIASAGGALGLAVGWLGLEALQALGGDRFSDWRRVTMDVRVMVATGGLAILTSLLFGLLPAWQASRVNMQGAMSDGGGRGVAGGAKPWLRRGLIVAEVALGVVLLVAAGLLLRTFVNLQSLNPGFRPDGLTTATVSLLDARYPGPREVTRLFDAVLERLKATPGVEAAAVSLGLPYERVLNMGFVFAADERQRIASVMYGSTELFTTFGIDVRAGRGFQSGDSADRPMVVVVNESFVRLHSPDHHVIGRRIRLSGDEREIVGVVADVQMRPGFLIDGMVPGPIVTSPTVYMPAAQISQGIVGTHVWFPPVWTVRAASHAVAVQAIERAIAAADPLLPVGTVRRMSDVRAAATTEQRLLMTLVGALALVALLLSAIGLHGLIGHAVHERTREFGIRLALGATAGGAVRSVMAGGMGLAALGGVIGVALAVPSSTLIRSTLYGVADRDPWTYVWAVAFLLLVAGIASFLPARRLLRLDPAVTLRG